MTVPVSTASVMSQVLTYLGGLKLPENLGEVVVDWEKSPLNLVPEAAKALQPHHVCPCEYLAADDRFGLEIQHHDGLFGALDGPVGIAFASGLANQSDAYNNMQALVAPNLAPPIRTLMLTKVKTNSLPRVLQLWGAAQEGVGRAVMDAWKAKWFHQDYHRTHALVVGVFIHPFAGLKPATEGSKIDPKAFLEGKQMEASMHAIYGLNYLATLGLLADALTGGLTPDERVERASTTKHPFRGFAATEASAS